MGIDSLGSEIGQAELDKYDPKNFFTAFELQGAYHQFKNDKVWYPKGTIINRDGRKGDMVVSYDLQKPEVIEARLKQLRPWLEKAHELDDNSGILEDMIQEIQAIIGDLESKHTKAVDDASI